MEGERFLLLLSPSPSFARLPCTFSAWSYLRVLLPVNVEMNRAIPHVQECLNEPHFVIWQLDAGKLRSSLRLFWLNLLWKSNMFCLWVLWQSSLFYYCISSNMRRERVRQIPFHLWSYRSWIKRSLSLMLVSKQENGSLRSQSHAQRYIMLWFLLYILRAGGRYASLLLQPLFLVQLSNEVNPAVSLSFRLFYSSLRLSSPTF